VKLNSALHFLEGLEMKGGRYPLAISFLSVKRDKLSLLLFVLAGLNMWVAMMALTFQDKNDFKSGFTVNYVTS